MIKTITDKTPDGKIMEFTYDTEWVKSLCVSCKGEIRGDIYKNYETRGNWCAECNVKCNH